MPYDVFLGIPVHRVPAVVQASGLAVNGWIPVDKATLATRFPNVFAVGDVTSVGTPKAGVFAENAAGVVADEIIARVKGGEAPPFDLTGTCYVEFGDERVARLDANFGGPTPTAPLRGPTLEISGEKKEFAAARRRRWFGHPG